VYVIALALIGAVCLTTLAMGALTAWQLRSGFTGYLQKRELDRLDAFVSVTKQALEREGGVESLRTRTLTMRQLMRELALREQGPLPDARHPPPQPPPPHSFASRIILLDMDGALLGGRPFSDEDGLAVERVVSVFDQPALRVRFLPMKRLPKGEEADFLHQQYMSTAIVATVLILTALAVATAFARQWARALLTIKEATANIAQGDFTVRLAMTSHTEIADVMRDINTMAASLEEMEAQRRRWLAVTSHELRTPLAILRGEIEALVDSVRPLNLSNVRSLGEEVERLSGLVDDLHLLSLADLEAMPCHFAEEHVLDLVQSVVSRLDIRFQTAGIELEWSPRDCDQIVVFWDAKRIQQALVNVLENCIRYTNCPGRVRIRIKRLGALVHLEIIDTAPGVDAQDLPRLCAPFFRSDAVQSRGLRGSGLGLAICRAIVHSHRGEIIAKPSEWGGLAIELTLPIEPRSPGRKT
jgi:two-component system, OmpR family, sensor histidine kinase BaeS